MSKGALGPRVGHIGIVVADVEAAARTYAALFGLEVPEIRQSVRPAPHFYRGEALPPETTVRVARLQLENVELELMQPVGGDSVWREGLDPGGPAVHHLGFVVPDAQSSLATLEADGYPAIHTGTRPNGKPMGYADARADLGVLIEVLGEG